MTAIKRSTNWFLEDYRLIDFLGYDGKDVMTMHFRINFLEVYYGIPSVVVSLVSLFAMIYFFVNSVPMYSKSNSWNRRVILMLLIFFIVCQMPMFICLSTDYGRLFSFAALCSLIVYFIIPTNELESLYPKIYKKSIDRILIIDKYIKPTRSKILFILLFIGIAPWSGHIGRMFVTSEIGYTLRVLYEMYGGILRP